MNRKSFTFGLGTCMVILSVVFYFLYGYEKDTIIAETRALISDTSIDDIPDEDIINKAKSLGMDYVNEITTDISGEEIIKRARELGMVFALEESEGDGDSISDGDLENYDMGKTQIVIEKGASATEIVTMLHEQNIIDDKDEFYNYVKETDSSKLLGYGEYEIPKGSSYKEIIDILKR